MSQEFIKNQYVVAQMLRSMITISPIRLGAWMRVFGYTADQVNKIAKDKRKEVLLGWTA